MSKALAIIGGGTMARAIIEGGVAADVISAAAVVVAEPDRTKHAALRALGVEVVPSAAEAVGRLAAADHKQGSGVVLLAIKPQSLPEVGRELSGLLAAQPRLVISILAGTPTEKVRVALGNVPVVRAMPNTPARIREGVTAIAAGPGASAQDAAFTRRLFGGLGQLVVSIPEDLMDAFTAVAGSGPAYVFYLADAMMEAADAVGFDRAMALRIVQETVSGSGALLAQSTEMPAELLAAVTSRGGTTAAALKVLDAADVKRRVVEAIVAARDRGRELGSA